AADEILNDPLWCPASVGTPVANVGGCSGTYGNLYALTNAVQTGSFVPLLTNSTIWVAQGAAASSNHVVLNSALAPLTPRLRNFTLTLKGGWTGAGSTIDTTNPSVVNDGISITWNNAVTISNMHVNNSATDGIYISTPKNISLISIGVSNNGDNGIVLN